MASVAGCGPFSGSRLSSRFHEALHAQRTSTTISTMALGPFPRHALRKLENRKNFPLVALASVREVRDHIDEVERAALSRAIELGAGAEDLAEALGITRQGAYYKIHSIQKRERAKATGSNEASDEPRGSDVVVLPEPTGSPQPP